LPSSEQPSPLWTRLLRLLDARRLRDRQDRHQAERELQVTIDTIPVLVARHRADGVREYGNKQLRDYLGPNVPIENTAAIIHPDDLARVNEAWRIHVASGEPSETEQRMRRAAVNIAGTWFAARRSGMKTAG
jgi:hypothetical protein